MLETLHDVSLIDAPFGKLLHGEAYDLRGTLIATSIATTLHIPTLFHDSPTMGTHAHGLHIEPSVENILTYMPIALLKRPDDTREYIL